MQRELLVAVFDTETTGLEDHDDIVQLASVICVPSTGEVLTFNELANPGRPIPAEAAMVHGISNEQVVGRPSSAEVVNTWWSDIYGLYQDLGGHKKVDILWAGHNVHFDIRKASKHLPAGVFSRDVIDSLLLCRRMFPDAENHQLEYIYRTYLGLSSDNVVNAHDALSDVWMVFDIMQLALQRLGKSYHGLIEWCSRPVRIEKMPFGKYQGKPLEDIPADYMEFLLRKMDLDIDMVHSFREELKSRPVELIEAMPFGKHKGVLLEDLPEKYVQWLVENCDLSQNLQHSLAYHFPHLVD